MGKRKYLQPGQTQHTRGTQDIITWRGNECPNPSTTYRSDFPSGSKTSSRGYNESEPIHVRSNLELRRRHLRAASPLRRSVEQLRYLLGMSQMTRYMESLELVSDSRFGNKYLPMLPRPRLLIQPRLLFAHRLHPVRVLPYQKQSYLSIPRDKCSISEMISEVLHALSISRHFLFSKCNYINYFMDGTELNSWLVNVESLKREQGLDLRRGRRSC